MLHLAQLVLDRLDKRHPPLHEDAFSPVRLETVEDVQHLVHDGAHPDVRALLLEQGKSAHELGLCHIEQRPHRILDLLDPGIAHPTIFS